MALNKTIKKQGIDLGYWRIVKMTLDANKGKTLVRIGGYVNWAHRRENERNNLRIEAVEIDGLDHTRETAYEALKTQQSVALQEGVDEDGNPTQEQATVDGVFFGAADC